MNKTIFIFKENNTNDRDCVKYIEITGDNFACDHYFSSIGFQGACFSGGYDINEIDFDNITTILTKEDFIQIDNYNKEIKKLGMGIKKGDAKYLKGIELYNEILKPIYDKLLSKENQDLFSKIFEEEKEYLEKEYNLESEDIDFIFNNYSLDYKDRAIVGMVYNDIEEASHEEAESIGYVNEQNEKYFDYEAFGNDLLESENYLKLPKGNVVYYMY